MPVKTLEKRTSFTEEEKVLSRFEGWNNLMEMQKNQREQIIKPLWYDGCDCSGCAGCSSCASTDYLDKLQLFSCEGCHGCAGCVSCYSD